MKLKIINRVLSIFIFLINIYFLPYSFLIIKSNGGPFGFGFMLLPLSLLMNLMLISAGMTFKDKFNNNRGLLTINGIGMFLAIFFYCLRFF